MLRAVRLLAVVRGEMLCNEIAPVLVPAQLIGMAKLAGLERELTRLARPCARPFDALLEGNPVKVKICGRDLARGAVGMREVEDVRIRLLRRRGEIRHHLPEVAGVSAAEIFRLVRPLREVAVHSHVDHRDARPVAVAPEVLRLKAFKLLSFFARLQERDFRVPVERARRHYRRDSVLGKIFEHFFVHVRIEFRPVRELDAVVSDALQELRSKPVAAEVVCDAELLLVSVHENLLLLAPYLTEAEPDVPVLVGLFVNLDRRAQRVHVAASELPRYRVGPGDGRLQHVLPLLEVELAGDLLDHLSIGVDDFREHLGLALLRSGDGRLHRQLLLAPRRVGEDVVNRDRRLDDEHRRILLQPEPAIALEQHVELVLQSVLDRVCYLERPRRGLYHADLLPVDEEGNVASLDSVLFHHEAASVVLPFARNEALHPHPHRLGGVPVVAVALLGPVPRRTVRLLLKHRHGPPLPVPEMPLSPHLIRGVRNRLRLVVRRNRIPVLLYLLPDRLGESRK